MEKPGSLVWFLAGASIGATIALLYAPKPGKVTRRYLEKQTRAGGRALSKVGRDALDKGRDLYDRGRSMADEIADETSDLVERGRQALTRS